METGKVKFFNDTKGFGFIVRDGGGKDAFVHKTAIKSHGTLTEGDRVRFDVKSDPKGDKAINVELV